jgi:hypothetical protein
MELLFALAGLALFGLALANVLAARLFRYEENLRRVDPVVRDVFRSQHLARVLLLLASAAACLLCTNALTGTPFGRAVAGFLALLFGLRLVLQFTHFDAQARAQRPALDALLVLTLVYLSAVLGSAAFGVWAPAPPPSTPPTVQWMTNYLATHAADDHAHEPGTPPHSHSGDPGHSHEGELAPEDVPIVRYTPLPSAGPHGGVLTRLATREDPEAGYVETRLALAGGPLEVWLFRDRSLEAPLTLPADARLQLRISDPPGAAALPLEPAPATKAAGSGNAFLFRPAPGTQVADAWLEAPDLPALLRLQIESGGRVYASDDFELYPPGHEDGR